MSWETARNKMLPSKSLTWRTLCTITKGLWAKRKPAIERMRRLSHRDTAELECMIQGQGCGLQLLFLLSTSRLAPTASWMWLLKIWAMSLLLREHSQDRAWEPRAEQALSGSKPGLQILKKYKSHTSPHCSTSISLFLFTKCYWSARSPGAW